ncbi:Pectate lyase A [Paramyrothecium foliicola]|nr:Pectate lyase A [Paramyrothecium foliicola]
MFSRRSFFILSTIKQASYSNTLVIKMHAYALLSLLPAVLACKGASSVAPSGAATPSASVPVETPSASSAPTPVPTGPVRTGDGEGPIGFAAGTTGGGTGAASVVTSCEELTSALSSGGVITISGMLSGCGVLDVPSDTTIIGSGGDSGMVGGGLRVKKAENVIIQNLVMSKPPDGKDLIEIEESSYVWVDHCDVSNEGMVGDKDRYDGLVDAKRGADFVTISYTKFHDHWKASLFGHSDSNASQDEGALKVTYHHNHWSKINSRAPSIRFGTAHIFSSCYEDIPTSGVNSRMGAQVLVEGNSFTNVKRAIVTNLDSAEEGFATERDNIFENSDIEITQEGSFTPPYEYTVDAVSTICELVKAQAGATLA